MYLDFFLAQLDRGPITANMIVGGMREPAMLNKKVVVLERPSSNPKGIESFNSRKGIIAVKKTISSGIM